jgi:large subunit ribosomal protein L15
MIFNSSRRGKSSASFGHAKEDLWEWKVTMASSTTGRSLQSLIRRARPSCECASSISSRTASVRQFSASTWRRETQYETDGEQRPRWSYTPDRMKAPYPVKLKNTEKAWECNSDPERLDRFYTTFLGRGGENLLTEEVKWLAITHKSFDQGRRGFNDRLAFFGMVACL